MTYDADLNMDWDRGLGYDSTTIEGPVVAGDSATIQIRLIINGDGTSMDDYTNRAEIGGVSDGDGNDISDDDQDSTPDTDPDNDSG